MPYGVTRDRELNFFCTIWQRTDLKQNDHCTPYGDIWDSAAANYDAVLRRLVMSR